MTLIPTLEEEILQIAFDSPKKPKAKEVMQKIGHRSYLYQNNIINTIYIRLRKCRKKTPGMLVDLDVYRKWNRNFKDVKEQVKSKEYPFLSLKQIEFWEPLAEEYQLDPITRGIKKSHYNPTDQTFLEAFRQVKGNQRKLCYRTIQSHKQDSLDWYTFRQEHLDNYLSHFTPENPLVLYNSSDHQGYPNLPTPEHLHLILHGYSPDPKVLKLFKKID